MGNILLKSFRYELETILKESGFKEEKAHKIVVERYNNEIRKGAIEILEKALFLLKEGKLKDLSDMTKYSPSGDGYGCDNVYIDFSSLSPEGEIEDIGDIIEILKI